jgi:hypothetical protein
MVLHEQMLDLDSGKDIHIHSWNGQNWKLCLCINLAADVGAATVDDGNGNAMIKGSITNVRCVLDTIDVETEMVSKRIKIHSVPSPSKGNPSTAIVTAYSASGQAQCCGRINLLVSTLCRRPWKRIADGMGLGENCK